MDTMNEIKIFSNEEFGSIRTLDIDGIPWFVGKDVATALGYIKPTDAVRKKIDAEDRGISKMETPSGMQDMVIINESGVYALIFSSKLESAKKFKHWVTSEVLPSIRRTGSYAVPDPLITPSMLKTFEDTLNESFTYIYNQINDLKCQQGIILSSLPAPTLSYDECFPSSYHSQNKSRRDTCSEIVRKIQELSGCPDYNKTLSHIYNLIYKKYGININEQKVVYKSMHRTFTEPSGMTVIADSRFLFDCFVSLGNEMIRQLQNDRLVFVSNFSDALESISSIAKSKFSSNTLYTYRYIYKQMEEKENVDWSKFSDQNKIDAIRNNPDLQVAFINCVNSLSEQ